MRTAPEGLWCIVGAWVGPAAFPAQLIQETPGAAGATANLHRWEPWVRAELIDFDVFSRLYFAAEGTGFTLWDVDVTATGVPTTASTHRIARLIRPPNDTAANPFWAKQLDIVANWAELRAERCGEILSPLTPPVEFWSSIVNLHPERHKWTLELLWAALRLANHAEMRFKHALACRRPVEMSPQLQPMILTPGHGSLPSGHSTEAHIVAHVLWTLLNTADATKDLTWFEQLMRQAARVAINRTIAGVHFPVDSAAGQVLGLTLGEYLVHRATGAAGNYTSWEFLGTGYPRALDFDWRELYTPGTANRRNAPAGYASSIAGTEQTAASNPLGWLWTLALGEWP